MFYPRFMKIIIHQFLEKDKSISMRNRMFMHTARDDSLLGTMRFVSRHADTQVYGAIIPKAMTNQALLDYVAYKTYYAIASGAKPLKSRKSQKKSDLAISSEESPSMKKSAKAKKVASTKPKPTKKKALVKADKGKGLNVLLDVALSEADQLKEATKRSEKDFHITQSSGSSDRTNFELGVPDEQHHKTSGTDEGIEEDDDDENDSKDESNDGDDDDGNDGNGDDDDANDVDNQEDDDMNDDDEETDKEKEKIDDEEMIDEEEDDEVTKDMYNDVNVNLGNRDADMTDDDQGGVDQQNKTDELVQSSSVSSDFTSKLLNIENPSLAENEIVSLMDTTIHHEEPRSQTSSLYTVPIMYAQALSSILAIVDCYIDKKHGEAIQKAIVAHNLDCREEAQAEKRDYIELVDILRRVILKEEVNTQLLQILPQAVLDFATPVIEKNVTKSLEAAVLARSSYQPKSTYEAAASFSEFELTKILIDKMEKNKSYDKADYKRELYDALVKSYQTDKDLFDTYGEVFTLKRSRDDKDKDQDPSAGSD
ncbi:hypothetical protein Tco_0899442 [Tanacetum coccineum]